MLLPLDGALRDRLIARRADVLKDAEKRRNRGLVVVRAQRAGRELLIDAIRAKRYKRNGQQDAGNPENRAKGCGQEGERLEQRTKGDRRNKPLERLSKHGYVAGEWASVQETVVRRIVVGNNDDWPVALGDQLARGMVHRNHVLAACRRAKLGEKVPTNSKDIKNEQDARNQCQYDSQDRDARAREDDPHKHQHEKHAPHKASAAGSIELLDVNVDVMLLHEVRNSLSRLELLLAVRRGDANLVLQVVQIIMCHGHAVRPPLVTQPFRSRECAYAVLSIRLEGQRYHPGTPWTVVCTAIPPQRDHMRHRSSWCSGPAYFSARTTRRVPSFRLSSKRDGAHATAWATRLRGPPKQKWEDWVGRTRRLFGAFEG